MTTKTHITFTRGQDRRASLGGEPLALLRRDGQHTGAWCCAGGGRGGNDLRVGEGGKGSQSVAGVEKKKQQTKIMQTQKIRTMNIKQLSLPGWSVAMRAPGPPG